MHITPSSTVGAAFGVLVAVFQHHWAQSLLGFQSDAARGLALPAALTLFGDRGLAPAPARASRRRARGWDHEVSVAAIGSSNE